MPILFLQRAVPSRHRQVAGVLLALGILVSLFVLGAQPVAVNLIPSPWDKLAHGGIFALLACGIGVASGLHGRRRLFFAISTAVLIGAVDEWHQMYLPGRQASWIDLAADVVGSVAGAVLLARNRKRVPHDHGN